MDPEKKAEWVEALRSGTYQQCTGRLRRRKVGDERDGYCCLGVLCSISGDGAWEIVGSPIPSDAVSYEYRCGSESRLGGLPYQISEQYNIHETEEKHLIDMNDGGASFSEIALYIEENL
jgi:hypothetical protein